MFGAEINNNPCPGNKEGGLTTIYEKSLGAIAKGGSTAMVDVFHYAEPVTAKGFVVMDTPGYDPVSMTGIVAGGANVLRLHDRPRQRLRLQAGAVDQDRDEHAAVQHMIDDMDINAGRVLEGVAGRGGRPADLRGDPGGRQRREDQERDQRRRRGGVRPVVDRADAVRTVSRSLKVAPLPHLVRG